MQDLTVDWILNLHDTLMRDDGGDLRIISEANLLQIVFRANLIPESVPRAAFIFYAMVAYPAFREGNTATARELALQVLCDEGYGIAPADAASFDRMAEEILSFTAGGEEIEAWLKLHAKKCPD